MNRILITISLLILYTIAFSQIPPGYYDGTEGLSGDDLKSALNDIIDGHTELSYTGVWNALRDTDEDPDNTNNVILLYTGWSVSNSGYPIWNREHTWAKSHGDFGNNPPCGTDVHHIRPTDVQVNGDRGNLDFDYSDNPYPTIPGCFYDGDSWEPRDEVKGDVARMIFYMAVRYEGENGELDLVVVDEVNTYPNPEHGKLSALLEWSVLDPPSIFEETRNDRIYDNWQGNRNPFVDHPEFADLIWEITSTQSEYLTENIYNLSSYPNPFSQNSAGTQINFNIPKNSQNVQLEIYNIKGQKVKQLVSSSASQLSAGQHTIFWDGTDMKSCKVKTGIYFINLQIDREIAVIKKCLVIH
ncbi:MAG: endonuclease [Candidatus Cloacimonadota bacterium]|nr:endonuclease [Candidatus Cloacimonadota bacterium]